SPHHSSVCNVIKALGNLNSFQFGMIMVRQDPSEPRLTISDVEKRTDQCLFPHIKFYNRYLAQNPFDIKRVKFPFRERDLLGWHPSNDEDAGDHLSNC